MSNSQKKSRKIKYTFILKDIDPEQIDNTYGINLSSNLDFIEENLLTIPKNTTKIDNLNSNETKIFSYFDESKKEHRCMITMMDNLGKQLPEKTNICCFWCRNQFSSIPIGCPISFVPSQLIKDYYSEITKDRYVIRENITKRKREEIDSIIEKINNNDKNRKISIDIKEYFITDGIFCSFNCCQSFIKDNKINPMYYNSLNLLFTLYKFCFGSNIEIISAPHWRLLKGYGGQLSIEEFRDNFYKIQYHDLDNHLVHSIPQCRTIGNIYEQKIKF